MNLISPEILKTERWFDLPDKVLKHPTQTALKNAFVERKHLNYALAAGRRSFKTERFLKRLFVYLACVNEKQKYLLGAPTHDQAKDIFWADIKALSHPIFVKSINETKCRIIYRSGSELEIIGLKEFRRKQGTFAHGVGVTEYQDCEPGVYTQTFQPMLNDTGGFWFVEGRPLGKNHFYDDYVKGQEKRNGWISFHWTSETVLSEEQIIRAKAELTDLDYRREYLADFETLGARPYYAYSEKNHFVKSYDIRKPLIIMCDFNATEKPMSWALAFEEIIGIEEVTYIFKTFSMSFTNTLAMCEVVERWLKEKYIALPLQMNFYGDYAGTQTKSNSSLTDWQIIEDYFRNKTNIRTFLKPCLSIRDSVGATNARLENALHQHRLFIDPEGCRELKLDWIKIGWKENGVELDDKDPKRTHLARAVDYYCDYRFPNYNLGGTKKL